MSDAESPTRWLVDAPEFEDAVRAAAEYHGILPDLVRKDYWVTRVLRVIATDPELSDRALFKGGTSLSKGWRLIDRFSEDIDLLLTGPNYGPPPEKRDRERQFRALKARIETETPLRLPEQRTLTEEDWRFHYVRGSFHCNLRYPLPGHAVGRTSANTDWLLVESGFRGGVQPHARRPLNSLVAEFIETQPNARATLEPYAADLTSFEMDLLKPERTFVEKLLALHGWMSQGLEGAQEVRTRHYYDLAQLYTRSDDVHTCITSGGLMLLVREAVKVSNTYFGTQLDADTLDLAQSPALRPTAEQQRILRVSYDGERALYYRDVVTFDAILAVMSDVADAL